MSLLSWLSQKPLPTKETSHKREDSFFGEEGLVVQSIPPGKKGKIRLCGVYWNAKANTAIQFPIPENTAVYVKERVGLTLLVEPVPFVVFPSIAQPSDPIQPQSDATTETDPAGGHHTAA